MLLHGDCLELLAQLPANSVDSCVTDPPYHLTSGNAVYDLALTGSGNPRQRRSKRGGGFMGKEWDGGGVAFDPATWAAVLRVLKPGGHMLAFAAPRNQHRMICAVEDAGFEIRDTLMWVFGSGFPKSKNVSKAIDEHFGVERELTRSGIVKRAGYGDDWDTGSSNTRPRYDAPATDAARQWEGWGSALKPAFEPICLARKPLDGTIAANVLKHGTGGLNINGCRIEAGERPTKWESPRGGIWATDSAAKAALTISDKGRWPSNFLHDGSPEVVALFPDSRSAGIYGNERNISQGMFGTRTGGATFDDSGSAARFFYAAKASKRDRIVRDVEEVTVSWISENGPCEVRLQGDTEQSPEKAIVVSASTDANGWSTFLSGSTLTALFRKASTFTTSMGTNSTTELKTWSLLMRSLTSASTAAANSAMGNGGSRVESAAKSDRSLTITLRKTASLPGANRALSGTQLTISVSAKRHSHPTCKPIKLMRYLVRLICPPGGTVLDPFAGSGTTGQAARLEGMRAILIEREAEYVEDIKRRLAEPKQTEPEQLDIESWMAA